LDEAESEFVTELSDSESIWDLKSMQYLLNNFYLLLN
jgi:hypothetical protein